MRRGCWVVAHLQRPLRMLEVRPHLWMFRSLSHLISIAFDRSKRWPQHPNLFNTVDCPLHGPHSEPGRQADLYVVPVHWLPLFPFSNARFAPPVVSYETRLPERLPPSYRGKIGRISYKLVIRVHKGLITELA